MWLVAVSGVWCLVAGFGCLVVGFLFVFVGLVTVDMRVDSTPGDFGCTGDRAPMPKIGAKVGVFGQNR